MNKPETTETFLSWFLTIFKVTLMAVGIFLFFIFIAGCSSINANPMVKNVDQQRQQSTIK